MAEDRNEDRDENGNLPREAGTGGGADSSGPAEAASGIARGQSDDTGGLTESGHEGRIDALGGDEDGRATGAGLTGAGSETGDASAMRSESGSGDGLGGPDAGSPGGMGGVGAHGGTETDRPPGGVSPVQAEEDGDEGR